MPLVLPQVNEYWKLSLLYGGTVFLSDEQSRLFAGLYI